ncbi:MAG TPA: hypothetical protein VLF62_05725 [Candidatus Saccharimonadales bacterium]|nr:hypothetical protein [Candidatus Saccharimonadales bacterium]
MAEMYSPEQIAGFLVNEKLAIHGVSPEAYEQNQLIVSALRAGATACSKDLISVQIVGSRANGTSAPESNLDLLCVGFDKNSIANDSYHLTKVVETTDVPVGDGGLSAYGGTQRPVPTTAEGFLARMRRGPGFVVSLFEPGVVQRADNAKLMQLAVTSSIKGMYDDPEACQRGWEGLRHVHADRYLGQRGPICEKLLQRFGWDQGREITRRISAPLIARRRGDFALPKDFETVHGQLAEWAAENAGRLENTTAYNLYKGVQEEVNRYR